MNRVGIFSHPLRGNFGGNLQAWALAQVLQGRYGCRVDVFGLKPGGHSALMMPLVWAKRAFLRLCGHSDLSVFFEIEKNREFERRYGRPLVFVKERLKVRNIKSLADMPAHDYDVIVAGSDQVWRKIYIDYLWKTPRVEDAFLAGISGVRKVAYGASFGVDRWEFTPEETERITAALGDFKGVSVRELSAVDLLRDNAATDATLVADPTMLLSADEYISRLGIKTLNHSGIISYFLDPGAESEALIDKVKRLTGLTHSELNQNPAISVEKWVESIARATVVVTDSFHGCVFAMIFRKPFICMGNAERGNARFHSLIKTFGIERNFISSATQVQDLADYRLPGDIGGKIENLKRASFDFLDKCFLA